MLDGPVVGVWAAVAASGVYHGLNPGMGWPLAVAAGLMGGKRRGLLRALAALACGHCLAISATLLPFAVLTLLVAWQLEIRLAVGSAVIAAGLYLLVVRRHPRFLARIGPKRLAFWSFAVASLHGAGLMLVPAYMGLCSTSDPNSDGRAADVLIGGSLTMAVAVAVFHTAAMMASGGALAFAAYGWFGPKVIARSWFNLERVWALSLVLVGVVGVASAAAVLS